MPKPLSKDGLISEYRRKRVLEMFNEGIPLMEISDVMKLLYSCVKNIVEQKDDDEEVVELPMSDDSGNVIWDNLFVSDLMFLPNKNSFKERQK